MTTPAESVRVVLRERLEGRAAGFSSGGELVAVEEDEVGMVRIRLLKLGMQD